MIKRYFYRRRSGFTFSSRIAFLDEDDDQIETWMIGPGSETGTQNRRPPRKFGD